MKRNFVMLIRHKNILQTSLISFCAKHKCTFHKDFSLENKIVHGVLSNKNLCLCK